ncbi:hypothetical protein K439DRAFT_1634709 [Ramaria rubella]|nr:hypothetical protein K439DRAFT_1634709 [Ramaria rubella]
MSGPASPEPPNLSISPKQDVATGDFTHDVKLAVKKIKPVEDLSNIGQIPCARNSLLGGIASGVGIGFIRGINARPWVAFNWAMGSFLVVTIGTWEVCRSRVRNEHKRMQLIVDSLPRLRRKRSEELEKTNDM